MSAKSILETASKIGLQIDLDGDDLALEADAEPPSEVLDLIVRFKRDVVAELRDRDDEVGWDAEDWQGFFDERAGIAEFDGGLTRDAAEARAFQCCISEWLNRHPLASQPGRCLWGGGDEPDGATILPFGTDRSGHAWLHPKCWSRWMDEREADAVTALAELGLHAPCNSEDSPSKQRRESR